MRYIIALTGLIFSAMATTPAFAGFADSWQIGQQELAAHPYDIGNGKTITAVDFHNFVFVIITAITLFVTALLVWIIIRYNRKANPKPATFSHNTMIEVVWTMVPILILIVIGIPSFNLLRAQQVIPEAEMTIKATGYQWYWGYEYPDHGDINFMSYMIPDEDIDAEAGQKRLLETDNAVVLPIDTNIQILLTSADVIHAFAVPAFAIKKDAVPGRLNETWVNIKEPGTYYGQCSEICGTGHSYMPIMIKAVTKEEFAAWVETAKVEFGSADPIQNQTLAQIQE